MNVLIIFTLFLLFSLYLNWGFRFLPKEKGQILAVFPGNKGGDETWEGTNLTYYGLLVANGVAAASALYLMLMTSLGADLIASYLILTLVLLLAMPAARVIAAWVEKKSSTFSTGAASFVGLLAAFIAILAVNHSIGPWLGYSVNGPATLAIMSISYCIGEGLGRLACVSFGCCYGKPLYKSHPLLQRVFNRFHFVFQGNTKKISYAEGWEDVPMIPIQAVTAIICLLAAIVGLALFTASYFSAAFLITLFSSQTWRFFSEFLRSDHRGEGRLSAYQILAILTFSLGILMVNSFSQPIQSDVLLEKGIFHLIQPGAIFFLTFVWAVTFYYLGRSRVTGATLSFWVHEDRI